MVRPYLMSLRASSWCSKRILDAGFFSISVCDSKNQSNATYEWVMDTLREIDFSDY